MLHNFHYIPSRGRRYSRTQSCKCVQKKIPNPIVVNLTKTREEKKTFLWSISSYLWPNLCFQMLISGMAVTEYKMQLKDTGFSYAVPDTFTWGLIQTPSSKTFMWSRTHGFHSHRFIPLLCVLNRSLVLSSVGSPIPLLKLSHGALLRLGLIPSVASSTGAAHYPSVVFLRPSFVAQPMLVHVPCVPAYTEKKTWCWTKSPEMVLILWLLSRSHTSVTLLLLTSKANRINLKS